MITSDSDGDRGPETCAFRIPFGCSADRRREWTDSAKMWPDRGAAGQGGGPVASASTGSRPYSPARRQSQLSAANKPGRPSFSPRSSSLSFSPTPNASTTSLPGAARAANGLSRQPPSAMRNQSYPDPVDVLNGIIGQRRSSSTPGDETTSLPEKPDVLCENIDFGGLSLEEFAHQMETQPARRSYGQGIQSFEQCEPPMDDISLSIHKSPIVDIWMYIDDNDRNIFEELHNSITVCHISCLHSHLSPNIINGSVTNQPSLHSRGVTKY